MFATPTAHAHPRLAVRAARRDPRRCRAGDVLHHLLPALVPRGAVRRRVPRPGPEQPRPRGQGAGAAGRDRRPQRRGPGRQPHRAGAPGQGRRAAREQRAGERRCCAGSPSISGMPAEQVRKGDPRADQGAAGEPGDAQAGRPLRLVSTCRSTRRSSRASPSSASTCASYPSRTLAAHIFGYVSEVSAEQLEEPRYKHLDPGDPVGQTGSSSPTTTSCAASQRGDPRPGRRPRRPRASRSQLRGAGRRATTCA